MVFVILGTQDKSFRRLLIAVEKEIEKGNIKEEVIVQAGHTKFESNKMKVIDFINLEEFADLIKNSNFIITHAGVGSILTALKNNKKVIAAARLKKYKEHTNDHQLQILNNFSELDYIIPLYNFDKLDEAIANIKKFKPNKYISNTDNFVHNIQSEIDSLFK